MTLSEENYLKTIYHLEGQNPKGVSTGAIAEAMQTKASSATDMVQRLADKKLLSYKPYRGVTLRKKGRDYAVAVIRRHRLWECFLVDKLNFSWDEVHTIAEELEHIKSEKMTDRLDKFLGFPKVDPHGDIIPDKEGKFREIDKQLLADCAEGFVGTFIGVGDSSASFLRFLDKQSIALGDMIRVVRREPFDQSLEVEVNGAPLVVSKLVAANLYVQANQKQ